MTRCSFKWSLESRLDSGVDFWGFVQVLSAVFFFLSLSFLVPIFNLIDFAIDTSPRVQG